MSKLFDAIERIRRHEGQAPTMPAASGAARRAMPPTDHGKPGLKIALALLAVILLSGGAFWHSRPGDGWRSPFANWRAAVSQRPSQELSPPQVSATSPAPALPALPAPTAPGAAPASPPPATAPELNHQGLALVRAGEYWRGIYYFDLARQADPQAPEPLINLGAALSELGLFAPAHLAFVQAQALAPDHPGLVRNLEILAATGHGPEPLPPGRRPVKP